MRWENIGFLMSQPRRRTELTDGIVEQTRRFHTLPLAEKLQLATGRGQGRVYRLSAVGAYR